LLLQWDTRAIESGHVSEAGSLVERDDVAVMLRHVPDEVPAIRRAWSEVEHALGSLRGRKFYGSFDPTTNQYAVCVVSRQGDDPSALGLQPGTLPGGMYVRVRLKGEPPAVYDLIPTMMQSLADRPDRDLVRPQLEFYRRRDEIDLLVPVRLSS
jgi:hypothetical protein